MIGTKPHPRFVFEMWCSGVADVYIAQDNPMLWPSWACKLMLLWGNLKMSLLGPFWTWR